jgi:hypothetical protein
MVSTLAASLWNSDSANDASKGKYQVAQFSTRDDGHRKRKNGYN